MIYLELAGFFVLLFAMEFILLFAATLLLIKLGCFPGLTLEMAKNDFIEGAKTMIRWFKKKNK